ncbi:stabilin-1-like [Anneissia japonica]|uniref:stabilin-1-like n=1 Tax=Anneissia japonica TaxID=1529436 RepID=UPI0014256EEC|nr:stabilin-1-like [Anneissia japonica]
MSGIGDLDCTRECDTKTTGKYGPGCLLDCHCDATECQPSEGCNKNATCHTGYAGTRCLEKRLKNDVPVIRACRRKGKRFAKSESKVCGKK